MARPRLSEEHHALVGTQAHKSTAKVESKHSASRPRMPEHLSVEARREWRKVLPLLLERGSLTQADASAVALYCETFARWLTAKRDVEVNGIVVTAITLDKRGEQVQNRKQNPALRIAQDSERSLRTYLRELGLTPAARERVVPTKPQEEKAKDIFDYLKKENQ